MKPPPRLYVPSAYAVDGTLPLSAPQQHYLTTVLRHTEGDAVEVFNNQDGLWRAVLRGQGKKAVLHLEAQLAPRTIPPNVGLLFAPIKKTPTDTVAQKATELGVAWLQPVRTQRTIVTRVNTERLHANVVEAAEQTGRTDLPRLEPLQDLPAALSALPTDMHLLFCDETRNAPYLPDALRGQRMDVPWAILIGPEGGFTPQEAAFIRRYPLAVPCHLGPHILRADTAAMMALSGWMCWLGDTFSPAERKMEKNR